MIYFRGVFKSRAKRVSDAATAAGFSVVINGAKPRKGAFVVTVDGTSEPVLEMLGLARPFTKLKETDFEAVGEAIQKLK
jgi:hypothetical protein